MLGPLLALAVAGGGLTPIGAIAAPDPDAGVGAWLPAATAPADMQALIAADVPLAAVGGRDSGGYADFVAPGHRALLEKHPGHRLNVYPSRRVAFFPDAISAASRGNAATARLDGHDSIAGARLGLPFVQPRSGLEAMWNHRLRYRGDAMQLQSTMVIVGADGPGRPVTQRKVALNAYANLSARLDPSMLFYGYRAQAGSKFSPSYLVLQHEPVRTDNERKLVWIRQESGKMLRVPGGPQDIGTTPSQGLLLLDMYDMYGGEADYGAYTWTLRGRRPLLVPYNAVALAGGAVPRAELLTPGHPDPRFLRYEVHRVWVVEATLLPRRAHLFKRRVFYLDEDSWNIVLVENYLADGTLARVQECGVVQDFVHAIPECRPVFVHDLPGDRYLADDLLDSPADRLVNVRGLEPDDFSPAKVRQAPNP